jgi:excisionase family DNA binding protein
MANEKKTQDGLIADGLMRVVEVAKFLAISRSKVYEMLDDGKLPHVRIDGGRRIPRKAVMDFVSANLVSQ